MTKKMSINVCFFFVLYLNVGEYEIMENISNFRIYRQWIFLWNTVRTPSYKIDRILGFACVCGVYGLDATHVRATQNDAENNRTHT